ncbi:MAG: VWA domain-containing protein [Anaerolineales bacterium]|nr:VWA domain-containing protein [Anaerolineales bacterium]
MSFIWPWMLFSLLLVPLIVLLHRRVRQHRRQQTAQLGALGIVQESHGKSLGRWQSFPFTILLIGMALLLIATARPQMVVSLPQVEGVVMLIFDVSASMAAEDIEPTRMEAAKAAAQVFIEQQPTNIKIGVVAFSDGGLVVQPPSEDRAAISATIERLVPQSGTSLGHGIIAALNAVTETADTENGEAESVEQVAPLPRGTFSPTIFVLVTDGENTDLPDPIEAAQTAIEQGVRIYTVGVGTSAGTTLEIDGFNVYTQLNEDILKEIAALTEGEYYNAQSSDEVFNIYENLRPQFVIRPERTEITAVLTGISMLVLLIGGLLSLFWFGRIA